MMSKNEYFKKMNELLIFYNKYDMDPQTKQNRKFSKEEYKVGYELLKDYSVEQFSDFIKIMIKKVEFFSLANLQKILNENEKLEALKQSLGIQSFDELYEN